MGTLRSQPAPSPADLDMQLKPCEAAGCENSLPRWECFSFIASLQHMHLENKVYSMYACPSEQHWCCSHEHAFQAVKTCIDEHHSVEQLVPNATVDPRVIQLPSHITHCAIASCDVELTAECYAVSVSYATPGPGYTAYICDPHPHWACNEEHAKLAAAACLEEHLESGNHG